MRRVSKNRSCPLHCAQQPPIHQSTTVLSKSRLPNSGQLIELKGNHDLRYN
jgi:hypothetical protein